MVALLLKFILFVISTLSNLITRIIFSTVAYLLVLMIQVFKVPGEAIHGALEQLAEAIRSCFVYFSEILVRAIGSLISTTFNLFIEAITESAVNSGSAVGVLVEKTRDSVDGLLKAFSEMVLGVSEFVSTIAAEFWKNYIEALGYVTENA